MELVAGKKRLYQSSSHLYLACDPRLQPYIAHYTICFPQQMAPVLLLVPDVSGCIVMKEEASLFQSSFWGATTTCVQVGEKPSAKPLYFVEFRPVGAYAFFQCPQHELQDKRIALEQLDQTMARQLETIYYHSKTVEEWVQNMDAIFLTRVIHDSLFTRNIVSHIAQGKALQDIFSAIGYSQRHTQRIVKEQLGCSMKTIQKIQRINKAVKLIQQKQYSLTKIATLCGYFDQAHFIHDFQTVCSRTPGQYQKELALFYNEAFKF